MWFLVSAPLALAQDVDFGEAAEAMMDLSFDLDAVEAEIAAPPPAAAARPSPTPESRISFADAVVAPVVGQAPLPLEPNSVLESVTVYRNQAFVTRVRSETIRAGSTSLRFEGLPGAISPGGISARVVEGDARIVGVELRSGAGAVEDSERIERVRADAARAVEELGGIRDRVEALLAQRAYLRSAIVPQSATATPPIRQLRAGLEYVGATEARIAERLRREQEAAEALDEVVVPLLRKLADPLATGREVWVEVESAHAGPVEVALRYGVSGASWAPAYNARLHPTTGEVELEIFGVVTQTTAEDWRDAEVSLATADPYGRASVQDLVPWTLGRSGNAGVFDAVFETLDAGAGVTTGLDPVDAPAGAAVVETRMDARVEGSGTVVLAIEGPRTIRGDGSPQRLPIGLQRLEADVTLTSVPKLAPSVQRRATARYDGAVPLLPGPVSTFVLSDYVGAGQIGALVPGEGLELEFGTDDRFRVSRQLVDRDETRVGRQSTRYDLRFRTTVTNHGTEDATVGIVDQLPRSEDVHVVVQARDLSGATAPGEDGLVRWRVPVAAGQSASVELAFSVTVPDDLSQRARDLLVLLVDPR